jgi:hypothetical protein
MDHQIDIVLRKATVDATTTDGQSGPSAGADLSTLGAFYIEDSTVAIDTGTINVGRGKIEFGDGVPQLIVESGKFLDGKTIHGDYTLPPQIKVDGGEFAPGTPALALPEGQSEAKEQPKLLRRILYGKAL